MSRRLLAGSAILRGVRRAVTAVVVVAVLAAGCTGDDGEDQAGPDTSARATSTTAPSGSTATTGVNCTFDEVPAGGEVTWLEDDNLMAGPPSGPARCLVAGAGGASTVQWSGDGTKVLVGAALRTAAGVQQEFARAQNLRLSRPTGRSVLSIGGERIQKHENGAADGKDITFVDQPVEVLYHPAGRSIVASGLDEDGTTPVLKIADNQGREPAVLAVGEKARSLGSLAFTASNALLFVGDHGDESHLHRLELATGRLTTVATEKAPGRIAGVTTSPFPGGGVAWTQGTASACRLVVSQDAAFIDVASTPVAAAQPVGWLPDRSLVVTTAGCAPTPSPTGDLYLVSAPAAPTLLVRGVTSPAVRAVLPTPEAAPAAIPDQAPA